MEAKCMPLSEGVELICVRSEKFKTGIFSVSLAAPLTREHATANALAGDVLYRGSAAYPDIAAISLACDELYGASVGPSVRQRGESQSLCFSASFLDDRYALDGTAGLEVPRRPSPPPLSRRPACPGRRPRRRTSPGAAGTWPSPAYR